MKQSIDGAKHFSEIVTIARELTTEFKGKHLRRLAVRRMANILLEAQINKKTVTVNIY